jgi:hypothetical protein
MFGLNKKNNEGISKEGSGGTQEKDQGIKESTNENTVEENATEKTGEKSEALEHDQVIENKEVESTENFGEKNSEKTVEELDKMIKEGDIGEGDNSVGPGNDQTENETAEPELSPNGIAVIDVKNLRLGIDKAMQSAALMPNAKIELQNSLFNAKAWLGKSLAQFGAVNPYITENPIENAKQIPPTADVYDNPKFIYDFKNKSRLEKVLFLREHLQTAVVILGKLQLKDVELEDSHLLAIAITQCYVHLTEARFELGAELSRIKNSN